MRKLGRFCVFYFVERPATVLERGGGILLINHFQTRYRMKKAISHIVESLTESMREAIICEYDGYHLPVCAMATFGKHAFEIYNDMVSYEGPNEQGFPNIVAAVQDAMPDWHDVLHGIPTSDLGTAAQYAHELGELASIADDWVDEQRLLD